MAKPFEMYVFDWDGTLMDTTRLIMQGYQHASKALGFPVPSDELVLSTIGLNRSDSIALCCCDCPKGRYAESGLETKDMVMVGDAVLDMQMAKNAGSDSVAVSYGASPKERLLETASLGVADNVPQLAAILGLEKYLS